MATGRSSTKSAARRPGRPYEQVVIESVRPSIDCGHHPVKAIIGATCGIEATVFRHGHDRLRVVATVFAPGERRGRELAMRSVNPGLDLWRLDLPLDTLGRYRVTVSAWTDAYASWVEELGKRVRAAQADIASEIAEGLSLVARVAAARKGGQKRDAEGLLERLTAEAADPQKLLDVASTGEALDLMAQIGLREDESHAEPELVILVERARARFGSWYELFVRSETDNPAVPGTFTTATRRLGDIRRMGFDVVYLAPIHPIGTTNRKGPNNKVGAGPNDPGSPWAIGSPHGGHKAVEPALGTIDDFERYVRAAAELGMEIALDLAIQCSPDHPWVREHPEWFYRRADGTIRYAENPPKKYEDIYPVNFDTSDWRALWDELLSTVLFWVDRGVKIFRVDNPHTKPLGFWAWLIEQVQAAHPDVIFLAEAFTRPPMMQALAKRGFTQSYTYFTWRNTKRELIDYMTELTTASAEYFRPNFFANTPDILPPILQTGGRPAFKSRVTLAAMLSPSYGIYNGYELCENMPIPGREEYLDSEKYQVRVRDWNDPDSLREFITRLNQARRDNPALQDIGNLRFLEIDDEQLIAFVKATPDRSNAVIVVVNLDPAATHGSILHVPAEAIGVAPGESYQVRDILTNQRYTWGDRNAVELDPIGGEPAHVLVVERGR